MPKYRNLVSMLAATSLGVAASAAAAMASGEINCDATDGSGAYINISVGHLPVLSVIRAMASDGADIWSTEPAGSERPMAFGQGYMDDNQVVADFTDPNIERIVVSLRLFQVSADKSYAEAGVLYFGGESAFPVQCENG